MVEVKSIKSGDEYYVGIHLQLPQYPMYMIVSCKVILAQNMYAIDFFDKQDKKPAVILVQYGYGFDSMLYGEVTDMNSIASAYGVRLGMNGKEALKLCEK